MTIVKTEPSATLTMTVTRASGEVEVITVPAEVVRQRKSLLYRLKGLVARNG